MQEIPVTSLGHNDYSFTDATDIFLLFFDDGTCYCHIWRLYQCLICIHCKWCWSM